MRALVTGGHGFVGRHLAQHLVHCGDDVALTYFPAVGEESDGTSSSSSAERFGNQIPLPRTSQSIALDVSDPNAVDQVIALLKPEVVYHLAGISFVPRGESDSSIFSVNTHATFSLLESLKRHVPESRLLFVSSSEVYGDPRPSSLPLTELSELRPISSYGVSKAAADLGVFKFGYREGLHVVRARPFPHLGPGQSEQFAIASFAKQIANIKLGRVEPQVRVGNLEARRDYTDVSDIVRGYREALLNGKRGEVYNLCSGESFEIGEMLRLLIARSGVDVEIIEDPSRMRAIDIPDVYGSYERAQRDFGWKPRVEREAMLDSIFGYWLDTLSSSS